MYVDCMTASMLCIRSHIPSTLRALEGESVVWPHPPPLISHLCIHRQLTFLADGVLQMSEQEWLTAAENTWRAIQQSADLGEFVMQLQETKLLSAGGWRVS